MIRHLPRYNLLALQRKHLGNPLKMMQENICEAMAKELTYIESSGCLRYIKIDYGFLSEVCRSQRLLKDAEQKLLEALSEVKRSSEICRTMQETPEHMREELYGQIYLGVKRAIERLEECLKIARDAILPLRRTAMGFSAALILLSTSSLILIPRDLLIIAILISIALFSAINIAITYIEPRVSITLTLILCLTLLASNILIGDITKIYASAAILTILILDLIILAIKI